jgi:ribonucleotide reductase alpha subunit
VLDKSLIKALDQMTKAKHTGALEVYHSLLLKYNEKRNHFSKEETFVRTAMAAMDNNYNVSRSQAMIQSGNLR